MSERALAWLNKQGITKEEAEKRGLSTEAVYLPSVGTTRNCIRIPFVVDGIEVGCKYVDPWMNYTLSLEQPRIFNIDGIKDADTLYICDNEVQVMALSVHGIQATCPPDWLDVKCLKKLDFMQNIAAEKKSVVLLLSRTEEAVVWERTLSHFFVRQKAYTVKFPEGCNTVVDVLTKHGKDAVETSMTGATPLPLHGVHGFADYVRDIEDYYYGKTLKMYTTGFPNLDPLYKLQPGTLNVITGVPASGKSEWVDQLIINTIRLHKWKWCVYSPESYPPAWHFQKLAEKVIAKPMFGGGRMSGEDVVEALKYIQPHVKIVVPDEGEKTVQELLDAARLSIMKWGVNAFLIDPVNSCDHIMRHGENETQYLNRFLSMMRNFARINNIWLGLICHPAKMYKDQATGQRAVPTLYDISGSASYYNKCDAGVVVHRDQMAANDLLEVRVLKVKNKYLGRPGIASMKWDRSSGRVSSADDVDDYLKE
jgi:twinkle protein